MTQLFDYLSVAVRRTYRGLERRLLLNYEHLDPREVQPASGARSGSTPPDATALARLEDEFFDDFFKLMQKGNFRLLCADVEEFAGSGSVRVCATHFRPYQKALI